MEKNNIDYDEPYEVKRYNIELDREKCLSDISENTIQFVEKKIQHYKAKIDSEYNLRVYTTNEHKNNIFKCKVHMLVAIVIITLIIGMYFGGGIYEFISIEGFSYGGIASIGTLLMYPLWWVLIIITIGIIVKAIQLKKNADIVVDSYSMKNKKWTYIIEESKEREKIYKEEINRLEVSLEKMKEEKELIKRRHVKEL